MALPKPDEPWVKYHVRIPESVARSLEAQASREGVRASRLARDYLVGMVALAQHRDSPVPSGGSQVIAYSSGLMGDEWPVLNTTTHASVTSNGNSA